MPHTPCCSRARMPRAMPSSSKRTQTAGVRAMRAHAGCARKRPSFLFIDEGQREEARCRVAVSRVARGARAARAASARVKKCRAVARGVQQVWRNWQEKMPAPRACARWQQRCVARIARCCLPAARARAAVASAAARTKCVNALP